MNKTVYAHMNTGDEKDWDQAIDRSLLLNNQVAGTDIIMQSRIQPIDYIYANNLSPYNLL